MELVWPRSHEELCAEEALDRAGDWASNQPGLGFSCTHEPKNSDTAPGPVETGLGMAFAAVWIGLIVLGVTLGVIDWTLRIFRRGRGLFHRY